MRGRPLVISWNETEVELEDLLERERDPRRRDRLRAFLMLRRGKRISDVSNVIEADYRTVQRWVSWYRVEGLDAVLQRTPGHAAPGRRPKLSPEQTEALLAEQRAGHLRTIRDAVDWIANQYGVEFTYTGMHAHLRRAQLRADAKPGDIPGRRGEPQRGATP